MLFAGTGTLTVTLLMFASLSQAAQLSDGRESITQCSAEPSGPERIVFHDRIVRGDLGLARKSEQTWAPAAGQREEWLQGPICGAPCVLTCVFGCTCDRLLGRCVGGMIPGPLLGELP
jgi:hypothetical protein